MSINTYVGQELKNKEEHKSCREEDGEDEKSNGETAFSYCAYL